MRVLAVMDSTGGGGAETSMAMLAPVLAEHSVELEVAYFIDRPGAKELFRDAGVPLFHVPGANRAARLWSLTKLIRSRRPDLVHTMVFEGDIIGRSAATLARVPVVSSIISESYGPDQFERAPSRWRLHAARLADVVTTTRVVRFHAVTRTVAESMAPRLHIPASRIDVIYRGRDPQLFAPLTRAARVAQRRALGVTEDDDLILAVGRQDWQKNLATLVRAFPLVLARRPRARLMIAGREGSETPELCRLADSAPPGAITFLGHRTDVAALLGAADVFVFPSLWEGLGGAVIEALGAQCPIVCSDLPVLREVVTDDDNTLLAELCDPASAESVASAVLKTLNASTAERVARGRQRFAKQFDVRCIGEQMGLFYQRSLLDRREDTG